MTFDMVVTMIYQPRSDNDRARRSDDLKKKTFSIFCEYSSTKKNVYGKIKKNPPFPSSVNLEYRGRLIKKILPFHPWSILSIGEDFFKNPPFPTSMLEYGESLKKNYLPSINFEYRGRFKKSLLSILCQSWVKPTLSILCQSWV